jgi:hypothetical protein
MPSPHHHVRERDIRATIVGNEAVTTGTAIDRRCIEWEKKDPSAAVFNVPTDPSANAVGGVAGGRARRRWPVAPSFLVSLSASSPKTQLCASFCVK